MKSNNEMAADELKESNKSYLDTLTMAKGLI